MIALRMRANGHSREAVEETIRACAPTIRDTQTGRNWQRYAEFIILFQMIICPK